MDLEIKRNYTIKNILINSFKFLILEWKLFIIVLAFYIFKSFILDQYSYANNDLTLTQQYYEFVLMQLPRFIFELLFWVSIIPLIILAGKEYLTKKQRVSFKEHSICISYLYKINIGILYLWKKMNIRYFVQLFTYKFLFFVLSFLMVCFSALSIFHITLMPEPVLRIIGVFISIFEITLGFILFLAPVIIVLENKTFIYGTKKSVDNIRNKFIVCLTFILVLEFVNPSNISFMFLIINQYAEIPGFDYFQLMQNPGFRFFQLILSSGWFIFYNAAIVGFYCAGVKG